VASESPITFSNQTIRDVVHTTVGGNAIRIRLSNTFGTRTIRFDAVFVGLQKEAATLSPGRTTSDIQREPVDQHSRRGGGFERPSFTSGRVRAKSGDQPVTAGETGPATVHGPRCKPTTFPMLETSRRKKVQRHSPEPRSRGSS